MAMLQHLQPVFRATSSSRQIFTFLYAAEVSDHRLCVSLQLRSSTSGFDWWNDEWVEDLSLIEMSLTYLRILRSCKVSLVSTWDLEWGKLKSWWFNKQKRVEGRNIIISVDFVLKRGLNRLFVIQKYHNQISNYNNHNFPASYVSF